MAASRTTRLDNQSHVSFQWVGPCPPGLRSFITGSLQRPRSPNSATTPRHSKPRRVCSESNRKNNDSRAQNESQADRLYQNHVISCRDLGFLVTTTFSLDTNKEDISASNSPNPNPYRKRRPAGLNLDWIRRCLTETLSSCIMGTWRQLSVQHETLFLKENPNRLISITHDHMTRGEHHSRTVPLFAAAWSRLGQRGPTATHPGEEDAEVLLLPRDATFHLQTRLLP